MPRRNAASSTAAAPLPGAAVWAPVFLIAAAAAFGLALYLGEPWIIAIGAFGVLFAWLVLRAPKYGLALAVAAMPLEAAGRISAESAGLTYTKVLLFATVLLALVRALVMRERVQTPPTYWALIAFWWVAALASGLYAPLAGNTIAWLIALGGHIALVGVTYHVVKSAEDIGILFWGVILGSVPVVAMGIAESIAERPLVGVETHVTYSSRMNGLYRLTSTFYDPNALGRYMLFALAITVCALMLPSFRKWSLGLLALALAQLYVLINTFSRGTFVALVALGAVYLLATLRRRGGIIPVAVMSVLIGVMLTLSNRALSQLWIRFADPTASSFGARKNIVAQGFKVFLQRPFIGYGPGNAPYALGQGMATDFTMPHNLYIEVLLATGVIGAILLTAYALPLLYRVVFSKVPSLRPTRDVVLLALLSALFTGFALHNLKSNELWLSIAMLAPLARLYRLKTAPEEAA